MFKSAFDKSKRFEDIHPIHRKAAKKYWTKLSTMCWRLDSKGKWIMVQNPTWKPWLTYWVGTGYPPDIDTSHYQHATKDDLYELVLKYKTLLYESGFSYKDMQLLEEGTRLDFKEEFMSFKNGISHGVTVY